MTKKQISIIFSLSLLLVACGDSESTSKSSAAQDPEPPSVATQDSSHSEEDSNEEIILPPIPEDYLALLSTEDTKEAFGNTLPEHIWLSIDGAEVNYVEDRSMPQVAQLGGASVYDEGFLFKPASEVGTRPFIRRGLNDEGPYTLQLSTPRLSNDGTYSGDFSDKLIINLPEGAQAGHSYQIAARELATDDQAQVYFAAHSYNSPYNPEHTQGVIDVLELGDTLTASWHATMEDAENEAKTTVQGAVRDIPLQPQMEYFTEFTRAGESISVKRQAQTRNDSGFRISTIRPAGSYYQALRFTLGFDLQPGVYEFGSIKDDKIGLGITDVEEEDVTGTFEVIDLGEYYELRFEFSAEEEDLHGTGVISHVPKDVLSTDWY